MHHFNPENMERLSKLDFWRLPHWSTMIDQVILARIFETWVDRDEAQDERNIKLWMQDLNR
jgi:hypothetical protein